MAPVAAEIVAGDGFRLAARVFEPARARGTVLIASATAVPQSYYARFAAYLAAAGLRVVTFDYRGIGASRPRSLRGLTARMTDWASLDASAVAAWARGRYGRLALVGHSFGGQILGLIDDLHDVAGALLVGSQLGWIGHWPLPARARLSATWKLLVPALTATFGYLPGWAGTGEDLPAGVAREWARWCSDPRYLMGSHPDAAERFARFRSPVLLYSFTDDAFAPKPAVAALVDALSGAPLAHRRFSPAELGIDGIGHFGFFRPRAEPTLWREAREWLDDVLDGRPPRTGSKSSGVQAVTAEEVYLDLAYGRD